MILTIIVRDLTARTLFTILQMITHKLTPTKILLKALLFGSTPTLSGAKNIDPGGR